jgi:hypothetical protein
MARKDANPGAKERQSERRTGVWEMRKNGVSLRAIAAQFGVSDKTVRDDLEFIHAQYHIPVEDIAQRRALESEYLDSAALAIASQVRQGHLGAIDRAIRISESRRKLWGVDVSVTQHIKVNDVSKLTDEELEALVKGRALS